MKVTSKGQVTIPQAIRRKAGLHPETDVTFEYRSGRVYLRATSGSMSRGRRAVERLRGSATNPAWKGKSTEQIMKMLRGDD